MIRKFMNSEMPKSSNSVNTIAITLLGILICSDISVIFCLVSLKLFYLIYVLVCIVSMISAFTNINRELCFQKLVWIPFILIILYSSITHYPAIDLSLVQLIVAITFYIFIGEINNQNLKPIKYLLLFFGIFHSLGVVLQFLIPNFWTSIYNIISSLSKYRLLSYKDAVSLHSYGYFTGFTNNPGLTGMYIINGLVALIALKPYFKKSTFILLFSVLLISLLLTGKRTMTIATLFAIALLYLLRRGMSIRRFVVSILPIAILVLVLYYGIKELYDMPFLREKLPSIYRILSAIYTDGGDSAKERYDMWNKAISLYQSNKLSGVGWNTFFRNYGNVPHNTYIQVLSELGIIGLVIFILSLFLSMIVVLRKYLVYHSSESRDNYVEWNYLSIIFFEIIFIIYSYTGNTMWDSEMYFMYFLLVSISFNLPVLVEERSEPFEDTSHI